MPAFASDNSLLAELRKQIAEEIDKRMANLVAFPTERSAGHIQGLMAALEAAEEIGRRMNSPQPERGQT